jgi:hypothetical protein
VAADIIDAILEGGPADLPVARRIQRASATEEKIKVPHNGGYEHFVREASCRSGGVAVVFRWTGRTRMAE